MKKIDKIIQDWICNRLLFIDYPDEAMDFVNELKNKLSKQSPK